ncbi:MAG: hypothetical protein ABWY82_21930 [Tardiphaga sp.]
MLLSLNELIDCAGTAYWRRRKALEHPDDMRNLRAAEELEELAADLEELEGSALHVQLDKMLAESDEDQLLEQMQIINDLLRRTGFSVSFSSGQKLLQHAIDLCSDNQD